jgi:aldose 1-epimerase
MKLLKEENFQGIVKGEEVQLFTLRNKKGCVAQFTNYGARWLSMWVPDKNDQWADVVLGFESLDEYLNAKEKYYGAIVGRVCGRIDKGTFELNGIKYQLANNDLFGKPVKNHVHGGFDGFSFRVWSGKVLLNDHGEETLELTLFSKDGEEGYPGNLEVKVGYTLQDDNSIRINYSARTDKTTIINLTNHAYFNLHNDMNKNVLNHFICVHAESSVECNDELIPTGNIISVKDTPLDFNTPQTIGSRMDQSFAGQLFPGKGYVVSYILNESNDTLRLAATVEEKESGRLMEVHTDQPCLQFYTGWLFDGTDAGKNGQRYFRSNGLALEAQGFPDAPNHTNFPAIVLRPGEVYQQTTIYRFLTG